MPEVPRRLCLLLLVAVLGLCAWRARTQNFTIDEAHAFQLYVEKPLAAMTKSYDACNHVLHTLLMKVARWGLGTGEMALRVPSLLGAAIYFAAVYRLTRLLFPGWVQLLAAAALVLHPLLLDLMVAARGYGLALGFFTWSLYCAIAYLTKGFERGYLWRSGVCAGLAVAANLTLLAPVGALGLVLLVLALRGGVRSSWVVIDSYGGPAVVLSFLILVLPLLPVTGIEFYFGADTLAQTSKSMVDTIAKVPDAATWWPVVFATPAFAWVIVPALFWLFAAGFIWAVLQWSRAPGTDFRRAPLVVVSGTLTLTVAGLFVAHHAAGMRYPFARSGLYLIPLFTLALILTARQLGRKPAAAAFSVLAVLVVVYANQTDNRYFGFWRFDASTGPMLRRMQDDFAPRRLDRQATLAVTPVLATTIGYYRIRRQMDWLAAPVTDGIASAKTDYFLLSGSDVELVRNLGLHVVHSDALSGTVLARRTP
jgi:hypothetical protein